MMNTLRGFKKIIYVAGVLFFTSLQAELIYVCNSGDNTISVIDSTTKTVTSTITVAGNPMDLVFTPNQQLGYILSNIGIVNNVLVLDVATNNIVATITAGIPGIITNVSTLAITPNGQFIYAVNYGSQNVSVINTASNSVIATVNVSIGGMAPQGISISSDGTRAYVTGTASTTFAAINTSTNTVVANGTSAGVHPFLNVSSLDGNSLYVTDFGAPRYYVISTVTGNTVATVSKPNNTAGIAINSSGTELYITDTSNNLFVINAPAGVTTTATITAGSDPWFITLSSDGNFAYLSNLNTNNVTVVDLTTHTAVATIPVGITPFGSAVRIPLTPSFSTPAGHPVINRFLTQIDVVNLISWSAPTDFIPVSYRIYRDAAFTDLAGIVPATTLEFEDHNRQPNKTYTYFIVAVAADGSTLASPSVTIAP